MVEPRPIMSFVWLQNPVRYIQVALAHYFIFWYRKIRKNGKQEESIWIFNVNLRFSVGFLRNRTSICYFHIINSLEQCKLNFICSQSIHIHDSISKINHYWHALHIVLLTTFVFIWLIICGTTRILALTYSKH